MQSARPLLVVAVGLGGMLPSCSFGELFKSSGSPCHADSNCPGSQVCCNGTCVEQCGTSSLVASVTASTDLVPGYEFDAISVEMGAESRTVNVNAVTELVRPRTVAQFTDLASGEHTVTVKLLRNKGVITKRSVTFSMTTDLTVPIILTRDCVGVTCGGDTDQCLSGLCVSARCSELDTSKCPPVACASNAQCPATASCARGICTGGRCLQGREETLCAPDQRCIPGTGCVLQVHECDGALECDDLTACTEERCQSGRCAVERDDTRCGSTICDPTSKSADPTTGCTPAPCNGDNCVPAPCETAACVDGACGHQSVCDSGQQCCGGVCAFNCSDPRACAGRSAGYVCRVSVGACDRPETCDGVSDACPSDAFYTQGTLCRAAAGTCDVGESCSGVGPRCPDNVVMSAGTVCRGAAGSCDLAETCTGAASACPVDVVVPLGNVCRPAAGACDIAETCSGSGGACPTDFFASASLVCRASTGACDPAESCTGSSPYCPGDVLQPSSFACRPSVGVCDVTEYCGGLGATCPADNYGNGVCDAGEDCRACHADCGVCAAVYSEGFEAADLSAWTLWENCSADANSFVALYNTAADNPAPGGGQWDLRLHTTGFVAGCQYPGAYAQSPPQSVIAGKTYYYDGYSRNASADGYTVLIFASSTGDTLAQYEVQWNSDPWAFNADSSSGYVAPVGSVSLSVRYDLRTSDAYADVDLLTIVRSP